MFDSPLSASAYDVLGVDPATDDEALRRAYRLRLRQTHPDTGGDAAVFIQVQRAWELVGTVDMVPGRLIIFPSEYFHSAYNPQNSF